MTFDLGEFDERVLALLALDEGWDSYGGRPPTSEAIAAARRFLEAIQGEGLPSVTPAADGGLVLEWHGNGIDVEVAFDPHGEQSYD